MLGTMPRHEVSAALDFGDSFPDAHHIFLTYYTPEYNFLSSIRYSSQDPESEVLAEVSSAAAGLPLLELVLPRRLAECALYNPKSSLTVTLLVVRPTAILRAPTTR